MSTQRSARRSSSVSVLFSVLALGAPSGISLSHGKDAVVIIADDVGYEDLARVRSLGGTPNLDLLCANGVTYTRCFANPTCSPSRRSILFGDWGVRDPLSTCSTVPSGFEPAPGLTSLAELIPGNSALVGKWHLGTGPAGVWECAPQTHGFDEWLAGTPLNLRDCIAGLGDYFRWTQVDACSSSVTTRYEPDVLRATFVAWWEATKGARLAVLAPALAHGPFHVPPLEWQLPGWPAVVSQRDRYEAMIVALDLLVGEVLRTVDLTTTLVIVVGDNGTPPQVAPDPERAKTTSFERGIHVPLIVAGAGLSTATSDRLAHLVDVPATVADFFDVVPPVAWRGVSLASSKQHAVVLCANEGDWCARSRRFKLRQIDADLDWQADREEFYDLQLDPEERTDRSADPAYAALVRAHRDWLEANLPR